MNEVKRAGLFFGVLRLGRLDEAGRVIYTTKDAMEHDGVFLGTEDMQDDNDVLFGISLENRSRNQAIRTAERFSI
jgi:hypothetical protein